MSKISWSLRRRCTICTYTHTANLQTTNTNHISSYIAVQLLPVYLSRNYRVIYVKMPKYNIGVCTDLLHIHREPPILHFYVYTIYYAYCCTQSQQQHDILLYNLLLKKKHFKTPSANFDVETWNHTEAKLTHSISCILFNLLHLHTTMLRVMLY